MSMQPITAVVIFSFIQMISASSSTSYNLLDYSHVHISKIRTTPINGYCVKRDSNEYICNGLSGNTADEKKRFKQEEKLQRRIKKDRPWKIQFDKYTTGIDIVVKFRRVSSVMNCEGKVRGGFRLVVILIQSEPMKFSKSYLFNLFPINLIFPLGIFRLLIRLVYSKLYSTIKKTGMLIAILRGRAY